MSYHYRQSRDLAVIPKKRLKQFSYNCTPAYFILILHGVTRLKL